MIRAPRPSSNSDAHQPPPEALPAGGMPSTRRQPMILLVDDDERLSAILRDFLELNRFTVHAAATGEDALRLCGDHLPDLVLLDIRMPGIGGLEVLRRIRKARAEIPAIVITYVDEEAVRAEAAAMGVRDYLLKPVNFEDLKELLRAALRTRV